MESSRQEFERLVRETPGPIPRRKIAAFLDRLATPSFEDMVEQLVIIFQKGTLASLLEEVLRDPRVSEEAVVQTLAELDSSADQKLREAQRLKVEAKQMLDRLDRAMAEHEDKVDNTREEIIRIAEGFDHI